MQKDKIFRSANIQEDNKERRNSYNLNRWRNYVIPLIVVILAIITYQYLPSYKVYEFTFEDVLKYAREFGYEFDKLPSNEEINKNIINCTSVALRIEQSVAFNDTGPELMADLNTFSSQLEVAKSSYTIMYTEGALFIWNFEQFINESLNYISNDSFMPLIWNNNLQSSIKESIEALKIFYSSVEKALEATSMAESFRKGTHKQVIRAKKEVQQFILSVDNPNFIKRIRYLIGSITDTTERNNLEVDYSIATEIDTLLTYLDSDLKRVAKILLGFKENLEKHSSFLLKLEASIEPLKKLKGNEREIKKVRELLDMIKENHKNFKARVNQVDNDNNKQKKYKVQYEYVNNNLNKTKKYVILDPSKKNSIISLNLLKNDDIDTNKISLKPVYLTRDVKIVFKLELNLLIGKEKIEKMILITVSEELNDQFYLGYDFLSSYTINKNDSTTKYNLIQLGQEIIEIEEIPDITNEDDIFGEGIQDIMNENDVINEENIPTENRWFNLTLNNFIIIISLIIAMFAISYQYIQVVKSSATDPSFTYLSPEHFLEFNFDGKFDESEELERTEQESNSFEILPVIRDITVECFNNIWNYPKSKEGSKKKNIKKKSTKRPTKQLTKRPTKRSTKKPTKKSMKQPLKRSTKISTKKLTNRSTKQSKKNKSKK